ncbi:MAG: outer membrane beta-barrel protein [Bacteroidia bacterium]|nr:outer membrane beta-barrel protein [Bacteroidia bacterium]
MKTTLLLSFALLCSFSLTAQSKSAKNPLQVGLGLTGIAYIGDLSSRVTQFQRVHPGGNLSLQTETSRPLGLQVNGGFGKFVEQIESQTGTPANTFVETRFFYGDLRLRYRFWVNKKFRPYLAAGAGVLVFSPRDEDGKFLIRDGSTRNDAEEKYNTAVPQLPVTGGVFMKINAISGLSIDYTYRFTPTDYLDNISQLGQKKGFDVLHALQVSFYFTMGNP